MERTPEEERPRATGPIRTRWRGTKTALWIAAFALLLVVAVVLYEWLGR